MNFMKVSDMERTIISSLRFPAADDPPAYAQPSSTERGSNQETARPVSAIVETVASFSYPARDYGGWKAGRAWPSPPPMSGPRRRA